MPARARRNAATHNVDLVTCRVHAAVIGRLEFLEFAIIAAQLVRDVWFFQQFLPKSAKKPLDTEWIGSNNRDAVPFMGRHTNLNVEENLH